MKNASKIIIVGIVLILLLGIFYLFVYVPYSPYDVKGKVTDAETGEPVVNARVHFLSHKAVSYTDGYFLLYQVPIYNWGDITVDTKGEYKDIEPIHMDFFKRNEYLEIQLEPNK